MSLRNLRIFVEVYKEESISKAANKLYISQPAVSTAIKELEKEYSVILFERMNKRLYKTEAADTLYSTAITILEMYDSIHSSLENDATITTIHLGSNTTIASTILPNIILCFQKEFPSIQVHVHVSNEEWLESKLQTHELDLALIENNIDLKDFHKEIIVQSPLAVITSKSNSCPSSMKLNLLSQYPLLLREKGSATRNYCDAIFESHNISIHPIWESTSTDALLQAATKGLGLAIVPQSCINSFHDSKKLKVISLKDEKLIRNCYLVYHKDKYLSFPLKEFINTIKQNGKSNA